MSYIPSKWVVETEAPKKKEKGKKKEQAAALAATAAAAVDGEYTILSIVKKVRVDATYRNYEGWEKKKGKLVYFKRNVFVPQYDYISLVFLDRSNKLQRAKIMFTEHNIDRKKAIRDETWDVDKFYNTVLQALQYPLYNSNLQFTFYVDDDGTKLDIREKVAALTTILLVPCDVHPCTDVTITEFLDQVYAYNFESFCSFCRTGKLSMAKYLAQHGHVDAHKFYDNGWNALHVASDRGRIRVVRWLVEEMKCDPLAKSPKDGWTALHCASIKGHFEIAKYLVGKGCEITAKATSGGNETPISLMMKGRHGGMLRYFIGDESDHAKSLMASHGSRPLDRVLPGRFNLVKPFHSSSKSSKMLKILLKKCEEMNM